MAVIKKILIFILCSLFISTVLYAGFSLGKINVVKNKSAELDEDVQEIVTEREEAAKWVVSEGEWSLINDELVIVGTGNGNYLMWPRKSEIITMKYKITDTTGKPQWNPWLKTYLYPTGESEDEYPIFKFAENYTYSNYDDWRVPTFEEIRNLHKFGEEHILFNMGVYWSSDEEETFQASAKGWDAESGFKQNAMKGFDGYIRPVRDSE